MITIDQAVMRAQKRMEARLADNVRALETRLLLEGTDPDDVDAMVAVFTSENEAALAAHLVELRAELAAWLLDQSGEGGASGC